MLSKAKWVVAALATVLGMKLAAQAPRPVPVINLDANAHTITQKIYCDNDRVVSSEFYVDGQYVLTIYCPLDAPSGLKIY